MPIVEKEQREEKKVDQRIKLQSQQTQTNDERILDLSPNSFLNFTIEDQTDPSQFHQLNTINPFQHSEQSDAF